MTNIPAVSDDEQRALTAEFKAAELQRRAEAAEARVAELERGNGWQRDAALEEAARHLETIYLNPASIEAPQKTCAASIRALKSAPQPSTGGE